MNIEDGKINDRGFKYLEKYSFSVQGAESNKTLKEIMNLTSLCHVNIKLKIKLENDKVLNI